jgi:hypothetical protein
MASATLVAFERPDQFGDVVQMLAALGLRQAEGWGVETFETEGMAGDAFGSIGRAQIPVPRALRIEGDVRPEVALAKARIPHQTHGLFAPQQLREPFAQRQGSPRAAIWAAADHHVTGHDSLSQRGLYVGADVMQPNVDLRIGKVAVVETWVRSR